MTDDASSSNGRPNLFQKGNTFGTGRPVGSRPAALAALDDLGRGRASEIITALSDRAAAGDTAAAEIILRRVWPPRKSRPLALDLPIIKTAADALEALSLVAGAVAAGTIDPDGGTALAQIIQAQHSALSLEDLAARLTALEAGEGKP